MRARFSRTYDPIPRPQRKDEHPIVGALDWDAALLGDDGAIGPMPGWQRRGACLLDKAMTPMALTDGASGTDELLIVGFEADWIMRSSGIGLAVVDNCPGTRGRVVAVGHDVSQPLVQRLASRAIRICGSTTRGWLEARPAYTGLEPANFTIWVSDDTAGASKYDAEINGESAAVAVPLHTDWAQVGNTGLWVRWQSVNTSGDDYLAFGAGPVGDKWAVTAGGRPMILGTMDRVTAHHYPQIVQTPKGSIITHGFSVPRIVKNGRAREVGIPRPQIRPTVVTSIVESPVGTSAIGEFNQDFESTTGWVVCTGIQGTLTLVGDANPSRPTPKSPVGDAWMDISIHERHKGGGVDLCYKNLVDLGGGEAAYEIPANTTAIKLWIQVNEFRAEQHPIDNGCLALVVAGAVALGGTRVVIPITDKLKGRRTYEVNLPWTETEAFTCRSIGFRFDKSVPIDFGSQENFHFLVDDLRIDAGTATAVPASDETLGDAGKASFQFTWVNSETGEESAPSPPSEYVDLLGGGLTLDLAGGYPGIDTRLLNSPPEGVDAVHVYVNKTLWEADVQSGRPPFRRLTPGNGMPITTIGLISRVGTVTRTVAGTGDCEVRYERAIPGAVAETFTVVLGTFPAFSVTGSVSGAMAAGSVGTPYNNGRVAFTVRGTSGTGRTWTIPVERTPVQQSRAGEVTLNSGGGANISNVRALQGAPVETWTVALNGTTATVTGSVSGAMDDAEMDVPYDNGRVAFLISGGVGDNEWEFGVTRGDLKNPATLPFVIENEVDSTTLLARPLAPWWKHQLPGGDTAVFAGQRIFTGLRDGLRGEARFHEGQNVVTELSFPAGTWLEGRSIKIDGVDGAFGVVKVLDGGDLWITSVFDPDSESSGAFLGTTGTYGFTVLPVSDKVYWSNVVGIEADPQTSAPSNFFDVPKINLAGLARVGQFLMALDRGMGGAYVFLADDDARDDALATGRRAVSSPYHLPGFGAAGPRCIAPMPDGSAAALGLDGKLRVLMADGSVKAHPVSAALGDAMSGTGVNTAMAKLRYAFMTYFDLPGMRGLFLVTIPSPSVAGRTEPGVMQPAAPLNPSTPREGGNAATDNAPACDIPWPPAVTNGSPTRNEDEFFQATGTGIRHPMHMIPGMVGGVFYDSDGLTMWGKSPAVGIPSQAIDADSDLDWHDSPQSNSYCYPIGVNAFTTLGHHLRFNTGARCYHHDGTNITSPFLESGLPNLCGVPYWFLGPETDEDWGQAIESGGSEDSSFAALYASQSARALGDVFLIECTAADSTTPLTDNPTVKVFKNGQLLGSNTLPVETVRAFNSDDIKIGRNAGANWGRDAAEPGSLSNPTVGTIFRAVRVIPEPPTPTDCPNEHWDGVNGALNPASEWSLVPSGGSAPANWNSGAVTQWNRLIDSGVLSDFSASSGIDFRAEGFCIVEDLTAYPDGLRKWGLPTRTAPKAVGEWFNANAEWIADAHLLLASAPWKDENNADTGKRVIDKAATHIRIRVLVAGSPGATLPANTLRFRFRYDPDQQQLDSPPVMAPDPAYDFSVVVDRALATCEWHDLYLAIPDAAAHGTYLDMNGAARACLFYDRFVCELIGPIPQDCFVVNPAVTAFSSNNKPSRAEFAVLWCQGHQVTSGAPNAGEGGAVSVGGDEDCAGTYGEVAENTDALAEDFETAYLIDLERSAVMPASSTPITCATSDSSRDPCIASGEQNAFVAIGDPYANVGAALRANFLGWGSPTRTNWARARYDSPGTATTFNVLTDALADMVDEGADDPLHTGRCTGLRAVKLTQTPRDGRYRRFEIRKIVSHTASAVTVDRAWDVNPRATDILAIAPIIFMVHLPENRTRFGSMLEALSFDFDDLTPGDETLDAVFRLEFFKATSGSSAIGNNTSVVSTFFFNSHDLAVKPMVFPTAPPSSMAWSCRLTGISRQSGAARIRKIMQHMIGHPSEKGR